MSSISKRACCMAAVGAIQGFRIFTDQRAFNFKNRLITPNLLPISPKSFGIVSATAAVALKSGTASSASQRNLDVEESASKSKESLRCVMYLSCWAPRRESSSSDPKLKLPHKVPESNVISAGLCSIPRKVRSAFVKRAHEGTLSAPPISDFSPTTLHCFSAAKAQSPPNCNGRIQSVSPSPSAAKPTRKMVSAAFSQQEVEVAEVLFGFARQITNAEENLNDLKAASSSSPSLPLNISSPIRVPFPISASPPLLAQPAEGPKKKRPRPIKIDEIISSAAPATVLASCQSAGMEIVSSDNADGVAGLIHGIANVPPPIISATQDSMTSSSFGQRYGEMIRETVTVSEKIRVKFEDSDAIDPLEEVKATDVPLSCATNTIFIKLNCYCVPNFKKKTLKFELPLFPRIQLLYQCLFNILETILLNRSDALAPNSLGAKKS